MAPDPNEIFDQLKAALEKTRAARQKLRDSERGLGMMSVAQTELLKKDIAKLVTAERAAFTLWTQLP